MTSPVQWHELLSEYFGVYMTPAKADTWFRLLMEPDGLPDTNPDELCAAIRFVRAKRAEENAKAERGPDSERQRRTKPTLESLIGWVRWYRADRAAERHGLSANTPGGFRAALKAAIANAPDDETRWQILCSPRHYGFPDYGMTDSQLPMTQEQEFELGLWTFSRWPGADRRHIPIDVTPFEVTLASLTGSQSAIRVVTNDPDITGKPSNRAHTARAAAECGLDADSNRSSIVGASAPENEGLPF